VQDKKAKKKIGQLFGVKSPCKLDFSKLNQEGIASEVRKPRQELGFLASLETTMKNPISSSY
jgi:hypothetical protein